MRHSDKHRNELNLKQRTIEREETYLELLAHDRDLDADLGKAIKHKSLNK
jgi:hypothetical protein